MQRVSNGAGKRANVPARSTRRARRSTRWRRSTSSFDDAATKPIVFSLPNGIAFELIGTVLVRDWTLPQFHIHASNAYAILRHRGVPLGKADLVGHMFAHFRR